MGLTTRNKNKLFEIEPFFDKIDLGEVPDDYIEVNQKNTTLLSDLRKVCIELSLDLIENDDNIKIEYLSINNDYHSKNKNNLLSDYEFLSLKRSIFNYIEDFAISKNKTKIIIDIHQNMKRFNYELKDEGFINSNNRCIDNYYWFEAVKKIKK
jgi:hypothetical protein